MLMYSVKTRLPSPLNYSMSLSDSAICNPNALCSKNSELLLYYFCFTFLHKSVQLNMLQRIHKIKCNLLGCKTPVTENRRVYYRNNSRSHWAVWVGWRSNHMLRNELDNPCCTTRYVFAKHSMALNPFVYFISNKNPNSWSDWILSDANLEIK